MKRILLFLAAAVLLLAFLPGFTALAADEETLPYVTDAANLLSESEAETLNQKAAELTEKYGIAVRILTVNSIGEYNIESGLRGPEQLHHAPAEHGIPGL